MATQSVQKNKQGPVWPLGLIVVPTPGTPIQITSLVDPPITGALSGANAPEQLTIPQSAEYSERCYELIFTACKAGATHGLQANTGNIYICMKGVQGAGNRDDFGSIVMVLPQGAATAGPFPTFKLTASALNRDVFSPYQFFIDADNSGDSCLVTLNIQ